MLVCLSRPFHICTSKLRGWDPIHICTSKLRGWDPKASLIHAFAALLLLAYSKILVVSYTFLTTTTLYNSSGSNWHTAVYYDAASLFFSTQHLPFVILAITVLLLFVVMPLLFLLLYPTRSFQKYLGYCRTRYHGLDIFADVIQGYYKNGTAGTCDYRYFSGLYLLWRIISTHHRY